MVGAGDWPLSSFLLEIKGGTQLLLLQPHVGVLGKYDQSCHHLQGALSVLWVKLCILWVHRFQNSTPLGDLTPPSHLQVRIIYGDPPVLSPFRPDALRLS